MAQTKGEFDALIKWDSSGNSVVSDAVIERRSDDPQLEMAVEDEKITGSVNNHQAYMFMPDTPDLPSLGAGIFGSASLTDGSAPVEDQQNGDVFSSETDLHTIGSRTERSDSGTAAAGLSSNTTVVVGEKTDNPHPLGSSQNPIRIIQQGNKYTSMQELSPEQLNQIMQVLLFDCEFCCNRC